tara:strand:- start:976 stop:1272 length:297 start_codon:yes stop_codon:yes gene_type:complete
MKKLVKIQREILENAMSSEAQHGVRKPIHVSNFGKDLSGFAKSYATYCGKMEQLIEAGFISRHIDAPDGYAYITLAGENFINNYSVVEQDDAQMRVDQ